MGEGQFTDAMAQQTALWHIAFRDQAVGLTHAAYSLAAVARNSHGGMKAPALQVGRHHDTPPPHRWSHFKPRPPGANSGCHSQSRQSNSRLPITLHTRDQPPAELSHQEVCGLTGTVQLGCVVILIGHNADARDLLVTLNESHVRLILGDIVGSTRRGFRPQR
jgi:hypothetical protein